MATIFKTLTNNDIASTKTLLHEAIPVTGTIVSGTYTADANIRNYSHGMFQSVYDYPYLSSSANHIFDITCGYSTNSALSGATSVQNTKKINLYNQMAQLLSGYDITGSIQEFDRDGNIAAGGTKLREVFFLNVARLLSKDEVKKQSFYLTLATASTPATPGGFVVLHDHGASTNYKTNSPAGEYGILYTSSVGGPTEGTGVGLLYYQAGIAVISASIFSGEFGNNGALYDTASVDAVLTGSSISASADGVRNRWSNLDFNNTTELNSTIYFCRANHSEFNYSSNPTYLSASKIRVKESTIDSPVSYITSVGLYSADNQLLATAKLSEPLKKTPETELTLRVRLDY